MVFVHVEPVAAQLNNKIIKCLKNVKTLKRKKCRNLQIRTKCIYKYEKSIHKPVSIVGTFVIVSTCFTVTSKTWSASTAESRRQVVAIGIAVTVMRISSTLIR